jgi:uncharacterized delta-60 repeat protein
MGVNRFLLPGLLASLVLLAVGPAQAAPGALDTSFGTGGKVLTSFGTPDDEIDDVALQKDGKIVAGGYAWVSGHGDSALARYNANGSLDTTFGTGGKVTTAVSSLNDWINAIAIQPDGKIVGVGYYQVTGASKLLVVRYNANGSLDTGFGTGGYTATAVGPSANAFAVMLQPDGKIVAAGYTYDGTNSAFALVRYNADGSLDTSFGTGGIVTTAVGSPADTGYVFDLALQPDGKILATGYTRVGSSYVFGLLRYNANGSLDTTFGTGGIVTTAFPGATIGALARAVDLQPDGKIVVSGLLFIDSGHQDFALARYNSDGSLDTSFGTGGRVTTIFGVRAVGIDAKLQLNGKIVVGGWNRETSTSPFTFALARYSPNGSLDTAFGSGGKVTTAIGPSDDYIIAIAIQPDGKIVAGGASALDLAGTDYDFALARYEGDTCVVPKLKGRKLAAAKNLIKAKQCAVGKVKKKFSKKVKKGRVISQSPAAGKKVAAATKVNLGVSKGPRR